MTTRPGRRDRHTPAGKIRRAMARARDRAEAGQAWRRRVDLESSMALGIIGQIAGLPIYPRGMPATRWLHPSLYPRPLDAVGMNEHRRELNLPPLDLHGPGQQDLKRALDGAASPAPEARENGPREGRNSEKTA